MDEIRILKVNDIVPNPDQPRKRFDEQALQELAASIQADGLQEPILVRPKGDKYEIVQGERRWRAHKLAGLDTIQAKVREVSDEDAFHLSVIENIQREQLTDIEEARAFQKYVEMGYTHEEIAKKVSKSRTYVTSKLRLLRLHPTIQECLERGEITESHAKQILKMESFINRVWGRKFGEEPFDHFQRKFHGAFWRKLHKKELTVNEVKQWADEWRFGTIKSIALHLIGRGKEVVCTDRITTTAEMECELFGLHPSKLIEEDIDFACAFEKELYKTEYDRFFRPWMVEKFWDDIREEIFYKDPSKRWVEPRKLPEIFEEQDRIKEELSGKTLGQLMAEILDNKAILHYAVEEISKRTGQTMDEVFEEITEGIILGRLEE